MFDIGWSEMLVIAVVAFIVIGPKELPSVLRTVASLASKARAAGRVFQEQLDEVMREANAADLRKQVDDALRIDRETAEKAITGAVDPEGEINKIWSDASVIPEPGTASDYTPPAPSEEPSAPLPTPEGLPPEATEPTAPPEPIPASKPTPEKPS